MRRLCLCRFFNVKLLFEGGGTSLSPFQTSGNPRRNPCCGTIMVQEGNVDCVNVKGFRFSLMADLDPGCRAGHPALSPSPRGHQRAVAMRLLGPCLGELRQEGEQRC